MPQYRIDYRAAVGTNTRLSCADHPANDSQRRRIYAIHHDLIGLSVHRLAPCLASR
jgi:hypothetical protein